MEEEEEVFQINTQQEPAENRVVPPLIVGPQKNDIYTQFLGDLQQFKRNDGQSIAAFFEEANAQGILFDNQLSLYLLSENKQVVVKLPVNVQVTSIEMIVGFRLPPELKVGGVLFLAFGPSKMALIQVEPDILKEVGGYQLLDVKDLANLGVVEGVQEEISVVKLAKVALVETRINHYMCEAKIFLGINRGMKLLRYTLQLAKDFSQVVQGLPLSLLLNVKEDIIHQTQASFKSRLSNYFSSKLFATTATTSPILTLHYSPFKSSSFLLALSGSQLLIFQELNDTQACEKVLDINYLQDMQEIEVEIESKTRDLLTRQVQVLKYLTSDILIVNHTSLSDKVRQTLCLSVYFERKQLVDLGGYGDQTSAYQNLSHVILFQYQLNVHEMQREVLAERQEWRRMLTLYDLSLLPFEQLGRRKSFSFIFQNQKRDILALENQEGMILLIEQCQEEDLYNTPCIVRDTTLLHGATISRHPLFQKLTLALYTCKGAISYQINGENYETINNVVPERSYGTDLRPIVQSPQVNVGEVSSSMEESVHSMELQGDLKNDLYSLIDSYSQVSFQQQIGQNFLIQHDTELKKIRMRLIYLNEKFTNQQLHSCFCSILKETVDERITDHRYKQVQLDSFNDSGLVISTIDNIIEKLKVIQKFMHVFREQLHDDEYQLQVQVCKMWVNLKVGKCLREIQEREIQKARQPIPKQGPSFIEQLIREALDQTAKDYGYTNYDLEKQGITSLTVIYRNVSGLDKFYKRILDLSASSKQADFCLAGVIISLELISRIQKEVLELDPLLQNVILQGTMFTDPNADSVLDKLYGLIDAFQRSFEQISHLGTQTLQYQQALLQVCQSFLEFVIFLGYQDLNDFSTWKNNFVLYVERWIGPQQALEFADKNEAKELLCRLAFDYQSYDFIYNGVIKWGQPFLFEAMKIIYEQEQMKVKESLQGTDPEQLKLVNKAVYRGFKMIDIFEQRYTQELMQFLEGVNKKLLALVMLRNSLVKDGHGILKEQTEKSQFIDTCQAMSAIGSINSRCFMRRQDYEYFYDKFMIAHHQREVFGQEKVQKVRLDENFIRAFITKKVEQQYQLEECFQFAFGMLCHYRASEFNIPDFQDLLLSTYSIIISHDEPSLQQVQRMLPGATDSEVATEFEILQKIGETYLSRIMRRFKHTAADLNSQLQSQLTEQKFPLLKKALILVFVTINNEGPAQFRQQVRRFAEAQN